jgi:hypothetical protein
MHYAECCMLNHGNTLVQMLHCLSIILLSAQINSSIWCTLSSVAISMGRPGQASSASSQLRCELLSVANTSQHKQETFLYEYPLHWVLLPTKTQNRTLLFSSILLQHGHHLDYWNQPLNMCMRVCYLDCHEAGLCFYLVILIECINQTELRDIWQKSLAKWCAVDMTITTKPSYA